MDPKALFRYWRLGLADADLHQTDLEKQKTWSVGEDQLARGRLGKRATAEIFAHQKALPKRKGGWKPNPEEPEEPPPFVSLLIAPFRLRRTLEHAAAKGEDKKYAPFWIPARLQADGKLESDPDVGPFFTRQHLEPTGGREPVLGRMEDFDTFLTQHPQAEGDWSEHLAYAERMFNAVAAMPLTEAQTDGFDRLPGLAILGSSDRGIHRSILDLYQALLDSEEPAPKLIENLVRGARSASAPWATLGDSDAHLARHLGQMGSGFPLGQSQRRAVHAALALEEGRVQAVNGPPGTGKTTMLQSVVASLWVEAALAGGSPPIVLACSTNNRAVTNVLDSFAKVATQSDDLLAQRWLPKIGSFGLYLPASSRAGEPGTEKYLCAVPGKTWSGMPALIEDPDYLEDARADFLAKGRAAFEAGSASVQELVDRLREALQQTARELLEACAVSRRVLEVQNEAGTSDLDGLRDEIARRRAELEPRAREIERLREEVFAALENLPFWEEMLSFLPPVRRRLERRLCLPFLRRGLPVPDLSGQDLAQTLAERCNLELQSLEAVLVELGRWQESADRFASVLDRLAAAHPQQANLVTACRTEPGRVLDALDPTLRHRLFLLAGHYWEGRWLLEMQRIFESDERLNAQSRAACEARFRRFAMLTPCMVSTFHRAPRVFDYYDYAHGGSRPLLETIDYLIVDEAGQVTPEVGAATFALARKALVVGDVHQIEPIVGIPSHVDAANLRSVGLPAKNTDREEDIAHRSSLGSVMLLARRATAFSEDGERGILLNEHRRSVPEIIGYCNRLVYKGRLEACRPAISDRILPAMGWAHLRSVAERSGSSWTNHGEAQGIAEWLKRNASELQQKYPGRGLGEIVAVITPFDAQRWVLQEELYELGIEAGTVHTFQGGERPLVVFSPVYSYDIKTPRDRALFFDAGPNMLNVAVSRAQDSFLVFGDMNIFDKQSRNKPSGLLASILFATADQEITDVEAARHLAKLPEIERISTLERHRELLRSAFEESEKQVLIVSPFLSPKALEDEEIDQRIGAACTRGVTVRIVFDRGLANSKTKPGLEKWLGRMRQAGAEVIGLDGYHNKTLAMDTKWIVEGSFNWLSASRDRDKPWQRHEVSLCSRNSEAAKFIRSAWNEVEQAAPKAR